MMASAAGEDTVTGEWLGGECGSGRRREASVSRDMRGREAIVTGAEEVRVGGVVWCGKRR
jgi:hypothetical protein